MSISQSSTQLWKIQKTHTEESNPDTSHKRVHLSLLHTLSKNSSTEHYYVIIFIVQTNPADYKNEFNDLLRLLFYSFTRFK